KVLDQILTQGGDFKIGEIKIGQNRVDQSYARIEVSGPTHEALDEIVLRLRQHGAEDIEKADVQLAPAPADGVFPKDFYVTTNEQTFVNVDGAEIEVHPALMDCAVVVDRAARRATARKFHEVSRGMEIVIGHQGIKIVPVQRSTSRTDVFEFMSTNISLEKPKSGVIRDDAPLPEVITDTREAQDAMREKITDVTTALMMGTMLHSMAAANLLPATVKTLYVDVNPAAVSKLTERSSFQSLGLVSDL